MTQAPVNQSTTNMAGQASINEVFSGLKSWSLGIAQFDKADGSNELMIIPIERMSMEKGLFKDIKKEYDVKAPDIHGILKAEKIEGGTALKATWLPIGDGNRMTAPDVRKNETVEIFRYRDTELYYWNTVFRETGIRRLEHVIYAFGNLPDGFAPLDRDSSYILEFDTKTKRIAITTSKSDGEAFKYMLEISPGTSTLTLTDNVGNSVGIISDSGTVFMQNADGAGISFTGSSGKITAPGGLSIDGFVNMPGGHGPPD